MRLTPVSHNPFYNPARRVARAEGGMTLQRTAPFPEAPEGYEFYAPSDEPAGGSSGVASQNDIPAQEGVSPGVTAGVGKMIQGVGDWIATPGSLMSGVEQVKPEIPGQWSEEDQYRQNLANAAQSQKETEFGGQAMFNLYGTSAPFIPKGTLGVAGGRPPVIGNEDLAYLLGNRSQVGVIGKESGAVNPNGISILRTANSPEGYEASRLVYAKDGKIVGAMQITKTPGGPPTIANTFVDPSFRRQGIATSLNNKAEELYGPNLARSEGPSEAGQAFRESLKPKEPAKPFYSAVERAIAEAPQAKASPDQWAAMLRNKPGIKPEEIEWTGLDDWLKDQKGPVTKQQVLDHVRENQVQVQEVMKGGERPENFTVTSAGVPGGEGQPMRFSTREEAEAEALRRTREFPNGYHNIALLPTAESNTKFSSYTLPGGERYREMLLTLPPKEKTGGWSVRKNPDVDGEFEVVDANGRVRYGTTEEADAQQYISDQNKIDAREGAFKSPHFDEPNVLAHVRFNDRTIDGKKTLFVEEVQSDWHQKGKREGYRGQEVQIAKERQDLIDERQRMIGDRDVGIARQSMTPEQRTREQQIIDRLEQIDLHDADRGVPDAPFKTTWPELAMKRIIRYAAENGYDKVAWTPGEVQAARYDLSKQVDSIQITNRVDARTMESAGKSALIKLPDGHALSVGVGKDGVIDNVGASNRDWKGKKLEDVVGKDVADKIMTAKNGDTLSGGDLKVGGEGMKGFYDKILPAAVNKLVKKHGAKVGESDLRANQYRGYDSFAAGEGPTGVPALFGIKDGKWTVIRQNFAHGDEAIAAAKELNEGGIPSKVHTVDITPSLRKSAMEQGFPQFAKGGAVKVTKASVNYSKGMPKSHCGICTFYHNHTCTKVQGSIDPAYWCELFQKQKLASGGHVKLIPVGHNPFETKPAIRRALHGN